MKIPADCDALIMYYNYITIINWNDADQQYSGDICNPQGVKQCETSGKPITLTGNTIEEISVKFFPIAEKLHKNWYDMLVERGIENWRPE